MSVLQAFLLGAVVGVVIVIGTAVFLDTLDAGF